MSEDPIGFAGGDPNLYGYVGNSPVNHIDPSGLQVAMPGENPVGDTISAIFAGGVRLLAKGADFVIDKVDESFFDTDPAPGLNPNSINEERQRLLSGFPENTAHPLGDSFANGRLGGFGEGEVNVGEFSELFPRESFEDLIQRCFSIDSNSLDLEIIRGRAGIPNDWITKPSKKSGGIQYINPTNPHERVRVMPGNPNSPNPSQQEAYVKRQVDGQFLNKDGNVVSGDSPEAHIPLDEFQF